MSHFTASQSGPAGPYGSSTTAPSLADLVSQSRKLTTSIDRRGGPAASELPTINLALDQLESQSRSLAAGGSGAGADSKA